MKTELWQVHVVRSMKFLINACTAELFSFTRKMKCQNGFTLMEVIIVVVIVGILAGLASPLYSKAVERVRISEATKILGAIRDAETRYALEYGVYTDYSAHSGTRGHWDGYDVEIPSESEFFLYYAAGDAYGGNPVDNLQHYIGIAWRKDVDSGIFGTGYPCGIYIIWIYENGTMYCPCAAVGAIVE